MTLQEFVSKYTNEYIGNRQCVDLANSYATEVIGSPSFAGVPYAVNIFGTFPANYYIAVANTIKGIPDSGDIVIWQEYAPLNITSAGHIAIFLSGDLNNFVSFDQNWEVGTPCHKQDHTYGGVIGWLKIRPKPPQSAADAISVLNTHVQALKKKPSLADTNSLIAGIKTWPLFTK